VPSICALDPDGDIGSFGHTANRMGSVENDFEKGAAHGSVSALEVIRRATHAWLAQQRI
jgi:hypothetical protein